MTTTLAPIQELQRLPSPAPAPQALACDGPHLWMGSRDTERIYAIDIHTGVVTEEGSAPGKPWGAVVVGDELRVTIGEGPDDDRYIRRYVFGHGFKKNDTLVCPEFSPEQAKEWMDAGEIAELSRAKHVDLVDIESGHWPMVTQPERLAELIGAARTR